MNSHGAFPNLNRLTILTEGRDYQPSDFTRDERRDILREAVFLCMTPLVTPRISSG